MSRRPSPSSSSLGCGRCCPVSRAGTSCGLWAKCPRRRRSTTSTTVRFLRFSRSIASRCPLSQVSPHLRKAIVAFEDQRFADHSGIDIIRIVGAVWADVREGRKAQGGSTITQQLARQSFLTREKKIWRKVQEIALARRIERMYSKDEILELYLNKVYFGDGLHGAEAAARGYFGKSASDLDLAEAALLAGLVNAPSVNAPTVNMSRAVARRGLVLNAMREQGIITDAAFERASKEKVAAGR